MDIAIHTNINNIPAVQWNALQGTDCPFLKHEFLAALQHHHAVHESQGWLPQYLTLRDNSHLVGALPMYIKGNSWGEFVFDWAWADAYRQVGLNYYPKMVVAVPYTPVTGQRYLISKEGPQTEIAQTLIHAATEHTKSLKLSSLHWLFTTEQQTRQLEQQGYLRRTGCQYHWSNKGYRDFEDYLSTFNAKQRKNIKRERRRVKEQNIELDVLHGQDISEEQWHAFHHFYANTFDKKGGLPSLSVGFFQQLGRTMHDNVVLILAKHQGRYVAGAFNLRDHNTLYGRHWGCGETFHSLHFEACYYLGLEYCIKHGLQRFEPGAQGKYKISRGFLPAPTWSAHWIAHPQFKQAIGDFLSQEHQGMQQYIQELAEHSPFKTL